MEMNIPTAYLNPLYFFQDIPNPGSIFYRFPNLSCPKWSLLSFPQTQTCSFSQLCRPPNLVAYAFHTNTSISSAMESYLSYNTSATLIRSLPSPCLRAPVCQFHPTLPVAPFPVAPRLSLFKPTFTSLPVTITSWLSLSPKYILLCPASRYCSEPSKHFSCKGTWSQALSVESAGGRLQEERAPLSGCFSSFKVSSLLPCLPTVCRRPGPPMSSTHTPIGGFWPPTQPASFQWTSVLDHIGWIIALAVGREGSFKVVSLHALLAL